MLNYVEVKRIHIKYVCIFVACETIVYSAVYMKWLLRFIAPVPLVTGGTPHWKGSI